MNLESLWSQTQTELQARRAIVVATIVRDSGSVPRRVGTKMLIFADGKTSGTIGGGAFEDVVRCDALASLASRQSITQEYLFRPEPRTPAPEPRASARTFGAICGGRVEVFLEVLMPRERLIICGGGHCGRALAQAASLLDWDIVVCDDRDEFARSESWGYPNISQVVHLSSDAREVPDVDESTFIALVGKGAGIDEAVLRRVLNSNAAYIGMIGSRRKRETVFSNLRGDGISQEILSRVQAPIGLDIGAETPAEIAISILAQIIAIRAGIRKKENVGSGEEETLY